VHHAEKLEQQRKEEMNWKIASRKVLSIVLWREVTKAVLNKCKHGKDTTRTRQGHPLLPPSHRP
jgi:hypothetical protein